MAATAVGSDDFSMTLAVETGDPCSRTDSCGARRARRGWSPGTVGAGWDTRTVKRFLVAIPTWLMVTVAMVAAAVVLAAAPLSREAEGWSLVLVLVGGGIFAALAIGIPQLQKWQESQAKIIKVGIQAVEPMPVLPTMCEVLEYPTKATEAARAKHMDRPEADADHDEEHESEGDGGRRVSFREVRRLEERQERGESLTADELNTLRTAQRKIRDAMRPAIRSMLPYPARQDDRSAEEYEAEAEGYFRKIGAYFQGVIETNYLLRGIGRLGLVAVAESKSPYKDVQVELRIVGSHVLDPDQVDDENSIPEAPRPRGVAPTPAFVGLDVGLSPVVDRATLSEMRGFVIANDAEGARVSFPQFDLRPDQEISLDVVHLLTWLPAERDISVEWTVTAMNADSANRGVISLRVGDLDIGPGSPS